MNAAPLALHTHSVLTLGKRFAMQRVPLGTKNVSVAPEGACSSFYTVKPSVETLGYRQTQIPDFFIRIDPRNPLPAGRGG